jgi:hypothetical protein
MAINIELENGSIKEYPTSYRLYYDKEYGLFTLTSKCGKCDRSTQCNHLDCAIYTAEYTEKDKKSDFKMFLFISAFWLLIAIFIPVLGLGIGGVYALGGVHDIWQSDKAAKKAKELIEFRDHGTIDGIKAHLL